MTTAIEQDEAELLVLGEWVDRRYRPGFRLALDDGSIRDATQWELFCASRYRRNQAWIVRNRDGCCGQRSCVHMRCDGCGGICPRADEIQTALSFCDAFLMWIADAEALEVIDDEVTAL